MNIPDPIEKWIWSDHMNRSLEEALSELEREAQIRKRCFDRWIQDGRLSYTDAKDRQERLLSAIAVLRRVDSGDGVGADETETQAMIQALESQGWVIKPPLIPDPKQISRGFDAVRAAIES